MNRLLLSEAKAGMKLESNIICRSQHTGTKMLLAVSGAVLTDKLLRKLTLFDVKYVLVSSKRSFDIPNKRAYDIYANGLELLTKIFDNARVSNARGDSINLYIEKVIDFANDLIEFLRKSYTDFLNITGIKDPDNYVTYHSLDVAIYSVMLGIKLKLSDMDLLYLTIGALLHDIGMSTIPKSIFTKKCKLTPDEYITVKQHTNIGDTIKHTYPDLGMIVPTIIEQHHEKWDGNGYPKGLKGVRINKLARIVAIADVYDAMTSERVYRNAILPHVAAEYIYSKSFFDFDSNFASKFTNEVICYPLGYKLLLSTGEIGRVVEINDGNNFRPKVEIFANQYNTDVKNPYILDLLNRFDVTIIGIID